MSTDLMIDWETWGVDDTALIRAGALAEFFPATGAMKRLLVIDARRSIDDQLEHGRTLDETTVAWWAKQEPPLSAALSATYQPGKNCVTVTTLAALTEILDRFLRHARYNRVWSRGHFDIPIVATLTMPRWEHYQASDVRTLDFVTPKIKPIHPHHPLSDVRAQIKQVHAAYRLQNPETLQLLSTA